MLYDYECEACSYRMIDVYQSIKDDPLTQCPSCNNYSLVRIIHGGLGHFVKDAKTIGQIADKNWKAMGSYKRSEIEHKNKKTNEPTMFKNCGTASRKEINNMTEAQKQKYIMEGKK